MDFNSTDSVSCQVNLDVLLKRMIQDQFQTFYRNENEIFNNDIFVLDFFISIMTGACKRARSCST